MIFPSNSRFPVPRSRFPAVLALLLAACGTKSDRQSADEAAALTGGDPRHGRQLVAKYGCDACHTIRGVPGADRQVGPPLAGVVNRVYIAGVLTNTPEHMVHWIRDPTGVDPRTAMPNLGVTEADARDIAAYLYSLR